MDKSKNLILSSLSYVTAITATGYPVLVGFFSQMPEYTPKQAYLHVLQIRVRN
jgi:hypothetical protein